MYSAFTYNELNSYINTLTKNYSFIINKYYIIFKELISVLKELISVLLINCYKLISNTNIFITAIVILITVLLTVKLLNRKEYKLNRYIKQLKLCKKSLIQTINNLNCHPILLRLAWSDVQTFDKKILSWPECGGANGSIQYEYELYDQANAGLQKAIDILKPIKLKCKLVSWADIIQMSGALAVELSGGPVISIRYGRLDAPPNLKALNSYSNLFRTNSNSSYLPQYKSKLPSAVPPFPDGAPSPEVHLRNIFYRMGFTNRDIVALMGAHTIGRAFKDRTGVCIYSSGEQGATKYTRQTCIAKANGLAGVGMPGGCSWTKLWLQFDNSYYQHAINNSKLKTHSNNNNNSSKLEEPFDKSVFSSEKDSDQLLWLPTDQALYDCPEFKPHFITYSENQNQFFQDYTSAHMKMSELGAKFVPVDGITI